MDFGSHAVELELFAYVPTPDVPEFLAIREDLLLRVAEIVESSGIGFAQPTQFVYLESDANGDGRMPDQDRQGETRVAPGAAKTSG